MTLSRVDQRTLRTFSRIDGYGSTFFHEFNVFTIFCQDFFVVSDLLSASIVQFCQGTVNGND